MAQTASQAAVYAKGLKDRCIELVPRQDSEINTRACLWVSLLLTPWSRVPLEKLTGLQLVKKFPTFYET
jgi:hypothetical protein